ncbi:MAG: hypothetical protein AAFX44_14455 [Pseudomonadota bacterium]
MKNLLVFLLGVVIGLAIVWAVIWYNPLDRGAIDVPIDVDERTLVLEYDSPISGSIYYVNSGLEKLPRNPASQDALFFPSQRGAHVSVHALKNRRGEPVALGIKHFALAEDTALLPARAHVNGAWQILIPGAGGFFIESQENYWPFLRAVLLPAAFGNGNWQGRYESDSTIGPTGTFEAVMVGASGLFADRTGLAKETLAVTEFSLHAVGGPPTAFGTLTVVPEDPQVEVDPADDPINLPSE